MGQRSHLVIRIEGPGPECRGRPLRLSARQGSLGLQQRGRKRKGLLLEEEVEWF